jgi:uncharacterized membrane protein YqjE
MTMADVINQRRAEPRSDVSIADLVKQATEQVSVLVRDELALARVELQEKGKHAGIGIGMFGGAGVFVFFGLVCLLTAGILGLALVMPAWLAALVVAVALLIIAGTLALFGRGQVRQATPPMPQDAAHSVKADIDAVTDAVREGMHR